MPLDPTISTLIGTVVGFLLPTAAKSINGRTLGKRVKRAAEQEFKVAKDRIHQKMRWLSRDVTGENLQVDRRHLVPCGKKILYLGEEEAFGISLAYWEANLRETVQAVDTESFDELCAQVGLMRKFVSKFADLKMAFKFTQGDSQKMALACYEDLLKIHGELLPEREIEDAKV